MHLHGGNGYRPTDALVPNLCRRQEIVQIGVELNDACNVSQSTPVSGQTRLHLIDDDFRFGSGHRAHIVVLARRTNGRCQLLAIAGCRYA